MLLCRDDVNSFYEKGLEQAKLETAAVATSKGKLTDPKEAKKLREEYGMDPNDRFGFPSIELKWC